mmetsp:Transcript_8435/g.23215  ORF Transcript_8435/g.23215 Transcript_8435/m.23215 type:complete len:527 (-) Transcript_8435:539-2119(-)
MMRLCFNLLFFVPDIEGGLTQRLWFRNTLIWVTAKPSKDKPSTGYNQPTPSAIDCTHFTLHVLGTRSQAQAVATEVLREGRARLDGRLRSITQVFTRNVKDNPIDQQQNGVWTVRPFNKPSRPLSSVILKEGEMESIVKDIARYLDGEAWYRSRGLPYHRSYVLHGAPGCGKTSLVSALAGEFRLPVYMFDLSKSDVTGELLERAMRETEVRSIILFEDVDVAFLSQRQLRQQQRETLQAATAAEAARNEMLATATDRTEKVTISYRKGSNNMDIAIVPDVDTLGTLRALVARQAGIPRSEVKLVVDDGTGLGEDDEMPGKTAGSAKESDLLADIGVRDGVQLTLVTYKQPKERAALKSSKLTFSSLLQILDGIKSPEGRVVIFTTNALEVLQQDPALCRPGRLDYGLQFTWANRSQLHRLFLHFYHHSADDRLGDGAIGPAAGSEMSHAAMHRIARPAFPSELEAMADKFVSNLPSDEALAKAQVTTAKAQGYFMRFRDDPGSACEEVGLLLTSVLGCSMPLHAP